MPLQTWQIDPRNSSIGFSVRHLVVSKVHGRFHEWSATVRFDEENPESSSAEADIEAKSIDTGDGERDAYLRSDGFFAIERFPRLTFKTKRVERSGGGGFRVIGDLTIRDVTRTVVLEVRRKELSRFSAKAVIDRKDFGLTFEKVPDVGGVAVGDKIEIAIEIARAYA
jgi:polyisoprenoid-binding protein YceI